MKILLWDEGWFIERYREVLIPLAQEIDGLTFQDRCVWIAPGIKVST